MDVLPTEPLICPGCGESNDSTMLFCIFCGANLQPSSAALVSDNLLAEPKVTASSFSSQAATNQASGNPIASSLAASNRQIEKSETTALLCSSCGRTDLLNRQFCVFCGGKIIPTANLQPANSGANAELTGSESHASGPAITAIPQTISVEYDTSLGKNRAFAITLAVAAILGCLTGFALTRLLSQQLISNLIIKKVLPASGMVIYANKANTPFILHDEQQRQFIIGLLGNSGSFSLQNIEPGSYYLSFGKESLTNNRQLVEVKAGAAAILGFPERITIKETQGAP